jgi:hypothetical protein
MAFASQMTLQTLQDNIAVQYTNSTDTPVFNDDDWNLRTALINSAISYWESQENVEWNQLWTNGGTTPTTVTASTTSYALPTSFRKCGDYVRIILPSGSKATIELIDPKDRDTYINTPTNKAYITGKPGAYVLNTLWTPATGDAYTGGTWDIDYYKYATSLSAASDIPDMSNPMFIVHYVVAKLFQTQSPTNYTIHNNLAIDALENMMSSDISHTELTEQDLDFTIGL